MTITIEKSDIREAAQIKAAADEAFAEDARIYGSSPPICEVDGLIEKLIAEDAMYSIRADGQLAGGLVLHTKDVDGRVSALFIRDEFQNFGIGRIALEFAEKQFPQVTVWTLDTPYKNYRNHHFYEKHGYRKYGETQPEANGFYLWLYRKTMGVGDKPAADSGEFNSEFCNVRYIAALNSALLTWKRRAIQENYRSPTSFALEIVRSHKSCALIIDARNGFEDDKADVEWGFSYLLPKLSEAGCREVVFIMNGLRNDIDGEMDMWTAEFMKYFTVKKVGSYKEAAVELGGH